jgi:hypothetical protein
MLECRGCIQKAEDRSYLDLEGIAQDELSQLQSHSICYRIALGPHQGRKAFSLQTPNVGAVALWVMLHLPSF